MPPRPERRRATRITTAIEARLTGPEGAPIRARLTNLSVLGLFATPAKPIRSGTRCRVELHANGADLDARGTVVRVLGRELALRFEQLPYESYERLRSFLISNAKDPAVIAEELSDRLGFLGDSAA